MSHPVSASCTAFVLVFIALLFVGLTGVAAAQPLADDAPRGLWDTTDSSGEIVLDNTSYYNVYQGERDIQGWLDVWGDDVRGETLFRETGGNELELESSIPRDQRTGRYSNGDLTALVRTPRVTSVDMYNRNGARLSTGATVRRSEGILVEARWNFVEAEDLRIEVREDGTRITQEVLSRDASSTQENMLPSGFSTSNLDRQIQGTGTTGYSTAYWLLDVSELSSGGYDVRVEGVEDLNFDVARSNLRINVASESRPSLSFDRTTVSQGENVRYTVGGGESGRHHAVAIHSDRLRSGADADRVFRHIGDTREVGSTSNFVYAVVRVSDLGNAVGGIDTSRLRTGSASVRLYRDAGSASTARDRVGVSGDELERRNVEVTASQLTVNAPGSYTTGQSVDVTGTASSGISRVAVYVRDRDDWEILPLNGRETHGVAADGRWGVRNVVLSDESYGGRNFRFPGTYSVAVVDTADLSSPPPRSITPTQFNRMTTSRQSISTSEPRFVGDIRSYTGQVAHGDRVSFTGTTTGANEIVVGFVGDRDVRATVVRGTRDGFVDRQIDLDGMRRGSVDAFAISAGRDGVFGDGSARDADGDTVMISNPSEFASYVRSFDGDGRTRAQRISRIRSASVERAGSDDLIRTASFRIADARTSIRDVVPGTHPELSGLIPIEQGEAALVRGSTNRNPADTSIEVEVTDGPDADEFDLRVVRSWSNDGVWRASFDTSGVEAGAYTVRVDDGLSSHTATFTVVEERERDPGDMEPDQPDAPVDDGVDDGVDDEVDDGPDDGLPTPGFTVVAALLALVSVALASVYLRRNRGTN